MKWGGNIFKNVLAQRKEVFKKINCGIFKYLHRENHDWNSHKSKWGLKKVQRLYIYKYFTHFCIKIRKQYPLSAENGVWKWGVLENYKNWLKKYKIL